MMALAKCVINELSVEVLEYPDITNPEQGLKRKEIEKNKFRNFVKLMS